MKKGIEAALLPKSFPNFTIATMQEIYDSVPQHWEDAFFTAGSMAIVDQKRQLGFFPEGFYPDLELFQPAIHWAEQTKHPVFEVYLALALGYAVRTREEYRKRSLPDSLYWKTLGDISRWAEQCRLDTGIFGVCDMEWLCLPLRLALFQLGSLQFQYCIYPYDVPVRVQGRILRKGDLAYRIHIPKGVPFTKADRYRSYQSAVQFFGKPGFFVCDSWLLSPALSALLPTSSNIRSFFDDFTIVSVDETSDLEGLWHLYGKRRRYSWADIPVLARDTAVRRAALDHIQRTGKTESAAGVFYFDGKQLSLPSLR